MSGSVRAVLYFCALLFLWSPNKVLVSRGYIYAVVVHLAECVRRALLAIILQLALNSSLHNAFGFCSKSKQSFPGLRVLAALEVLYKSIPKGHCSLLQLKSD